MFYSSSIFTEVGFSGRYGSAILGVVSIVSVFISMALLGSKYNKLLKGIFYFFVGFGRRQLLIFFSSLLACDAIALGIVFFYVD